MAKQISITIRDWVFDTYLRNFGGSNKSAFIEENFLRGIDKTETGSMDFRGKMLELNKTIRDLQDENKRLKALNARYFKAAGGKTPEEKEQEKQQELRQEWVRRQNQSFRESGALSDFASGRYRVKEGDNKNGA